MATTKRNRAILNLAMVVLAAIVVVAGVVFVMTVRGGQENPSPYVTTEKVGYANIERAGISYTLDEGTALQVDDAIETLNGSEVVVSASGNTAIYLADASQMKVKADEAARSGASLQLLNGCVLADANASGEPLSFTASDLTCSSEDAVFVLDVRTGTVTAQVLAGSVEFDDGTVVAKGETYTVLAGQSEKDAAGGDSQAASTSASAQTTSGSLSLASLDSFVLEHALQLVGAGRELVFDENALTGEVNRRENEKLQLAEEASGENSAADASQQASGDPSADGAQAEAPGEADEGAAGEQEQHETATNEAEPAKAEEASADKAYTCTLQIRCDTILDNMGKLAEGKNKYVPKSGELLRSTKVVFEEGETAFDVLQRVCADQGIALEYSYVPLYGSYYIEGIGNLYEFDCGDQSGWMFKVNGWFPNYGCSEYTLSDGDAVVFCYTCNGVGADVGA